VFNPSVYFVVNEIKAVHGHPVYTRYIINNQDELNDMAEVQVKQDY